MVSVIVPMFNSANYILETVHSILLQKVDLEIIIINDGSTDNSQTVVQSIGDNRIKYIYQSNQGVSIARNNGFKIAIGEYCCFFDSDDMMSPDFLQSRIEVLLKNKAQMVCGNVLNFTHKHGLDTSNSLTGIFGNKAIEQLLLYDKYTSTCPSNYVFKTSFLRTYSLQFEPLLSSTADRYFLAQCLVHTIPAFSKSAPLHYRIDDNSMSRSFSQKLVTDNELYYKLLIKNKLIPSKILQRVLKKGYYILAASNFKLKNYFKTIYYTFQYMLRWL